MRHLKRKLILLILFIGIVIYILKFSPLSYYIFSNEGRTIFQEKMSFYIKSAGIWAPFIFVFLYALSIMFFIPASVFTSIGGLVFGGWYGFLLNFIGANTGGVLSYFLARYLLRDFAEKLLTKKHFKKFDDKVEEHGFAIILYLRLLFVPFTYLNFAVGLSKIKFRQFFWATFFGIIPGLIVITFLASAVKNLLLTYKNPHDLLRMDIILPILLFIFSFFIPPIIKHFKDKFFITQEIEKELPEE